MASERPEERHIGQSAVVPERDDTTLRAPELDELLNENKRLREIVVFLSEIIIRDAVRRT